MKRLNKKLLIVGVGILSITFLIGLKSSRASNYTGTGNGEHLVVPKPNQLFGEWVSPIPGNDRDIQGFVLNNDGTARSINTTTLKYQLWHVHQDKLILTMHHAVDKKPSVGQEVYTIDSLSGNRLYLKHGQIPLIYWRIK